MIFKTILKKFMPKNVLSLILAFGLTASSFLSFGAEIIKPENVESTYELTHYSKAFMLSDLDGYYPIFAYNTSGSLGIASLTKLMTLSIVLDEIENKNISLFDLVTISEHALAQDGNGLKLCVNEKISVDDLIHGMLICSSNDAAVALAEHIAGSEDAFVDLMNQKAKELGFISVSFVNASGLTQYDSNNAPLPNQNRMTSDDLLKLTQYLLFQYPQITEITNLESWTLASKEIVKKNTNALLEIMPEVNGFKTGFTNYAGYCQITTAHLDFGTANTSIIDEITHEFNFFPAEKEVVSIVLGASSKYKRSNISATLIDYAKNQCTLYGLVNENVPIYTKEVNLPSQYGIFPTETISITYPKSSHIDYTIVLNPNWKMHPEFSPQLPVGKIIFYDNDHYLLSVDLIIKELSQY